ncbi:DNA polymerase IV 1 [Xylanibacillus composti]|uniref:DNA polymerase IV n=1 Tax=Xylanibacillus composti TaxID=1572762 RepID=A0A8J4M0W5_9BACL|nr:DNA polymerase IV 1 [Xylanibacillus composti]
MLHIDMNAFYCSVHEAEDPDTYKGKPCAVAGSVEQRRGILVTASYAARAKGVRTGMQVREALKRCPELLLIQPDFALYRQYSKRFVKIVESYTPLVQVMSIDECYADITGSKQFGTPIEIARSIQRRIREELSLPCSIGLAPNKLLAKVASDMKKPNGLTVLRRRDVPQLLWDKPCSYMYGIGAKTAAKLEKLGIRTLGQLAKADERLLSDRFGIMGPALIRAANGIDDSPVNPEREPNKSIGHTTTLPENITAYEEASRVYLNIADQVCRRLRRQKLVAHTVQITIRDPGMKTITRSQTLNSPTDDVREVYKAACELHRTQWKEGKEIRLLGITLQGLEEKDRAARQLDLFSYEEAPKRDKLLATMDRLRDKFGESSLLTAGMLSEDPSALIRDHKRRGTSLQKDMLWAENEGSGEENDPS